MEDNGVEKNGSVVKHVENSQLSQPIGVQHVINHWLVCAAQQHGMHPDVCIFSAHLGNVSETTCGSPSLLLLFSSGSSCDTVITVLDPSGSDIITGHDARCMCITEWAQEL